MGLVADSSPDSMSSDDCTDTPLFGTILFDGVPKDDLSGSYVSCSTQTHLHEFLNYKYIIISSKKFKRNNLINKKIITKSWSLSAAKLQTPFERKSAI